MRAYDWLDRLLCRLGCHRWDYPGGHCESCGACDEFLEMHRRCRMTAVMAVVESEDDR